VDRFLSAGPSRVGERSVIIQSVDDSSICGKKGIFGKKGRLLSDTEERLGDGRKLPR